MADDRALEAVIWARMELLLVGIKTKETLTLERTTYGVLPAGPRSFEPEFLNSNPFADSSRLGL